jgi:hypothetical protein
MPASEEDILSGAHMCSDNFQGDALLLLRITWVLGTAWEILTLCLAVWIAVKHFRELQGPPTTWTVGDSFRVLLKTHLFYFARFAHGFTDVIIQCFPLNFHSSFVAVSSMQLSYFSPTISVCQPMINI